jgi:hypothetical protein
MKRPLQVTFRNVEHSDALEAAIRERAVWLERFHDGITACRVLVERPHGHRRDGGQVHVRIDVAVPGEEIVVTHDPSLHGGLRDVEEPAHHKATELDCVHQYEDAAVRDAFDVARRRLQDAARRQRGDVKTHETT